MSSDTTSSTSSANYREIPPAKYGQPLVDHLADKYRILDCSGSNYGDSLYRCVAFLQHGDAGRYQECREMVAKSIEDNKTPASVQQLVQDMADAPLYDADNNRLTTLEQLASHIRRSGSYGGLKPDLLLLSHLLKMSFHVIVRSGDAGSSVSESDLSCPSPDAQSYDLLYHNLPDLQLFQVLLPSDQELPAGIVTDMATESDDANQKKHQVDAEAAKFAQRQLQLQQQRE